MPRVVLGPGLTNIICVCISIDSREREGRQLGKSRTPEAYRQSDIRRLESKEGDALGGCLWKPLLASQQTAGASQFWAAGEACAEALAEGLGMRLVWGWGEQCEVTAQELGGSFEVSILQGQG